MKGGPVLSVRKILIIDDEPDILYTIKEICLLAGWKPLLASNGKQGYELFKAHHPDLVMVDYHMPGWDGLTTVRSIREVDRIVPILVLTVDERQEIAEKFVAAGATDFAIKPIKSPDLISRIKINLKIMEMEQQYAKDNRDIFIDKGICSATMDAIINFLRGQPEALTIEEITSGVNLAYQTVHRYLQYLVDKDRVEVVLQYGKVGRPRNRYKLKKYR